ncbi:MAG: hypothetical protein U0791_12685 [Gemmataceae bacterium]
MTLAYYTMDEVNRFLVSRWAKKLNLRTAFPRVQPAAESPEVVLLDMDRLPPGITVEAFLNRPEWDRPRVIVHGHNIADGDAAKWRANGVRVCRGCVRKSLLPGYRGQSTTGSPDSVSIASSRLYLASRSECVTEPTLI